MHLKQALKQLSARLGKPALSPLRLAFVTRQIAALLQAGLPLERALSAIALQMQEPKARDLLERVRAAVREGRSFAQALSLDSRVFSPDYLGLVAAGERSGQLPFVLERLGDSLEARQQLRAGILTALAYPLIVASVALLILLMLMGYVVPQVVSVFSSQQQELPLLTRLLVYSSRFLEAWGGWLLAMLGIGAAGIMAWLLSSAAARLRLDGLIWRLPVIGRIVQLAASARFCDTLSILLTGGVPATQALTLTARSVSNRWLQSKLVQAIAWVREGAEIGRALERTKAFLPLLVQMVMTGERSGDLPRLLDVAAKEFARELKLRTQVLVTVLEPLLILVMGLIVLGIVLAVMMPLIELNSMSF